MKRKFILFGLALVLSLFITKVKTECGEGCLSCSENSDNEDKTCSICDLNRGYVKSSEDKCQLREVENCEVPSLNRLLSICLLCIPQYILDPVQEKCVAVNLSQIIPDCERYSQSGSCSECAAGHYIFGGQCVKSEVTVEGCERYSQEGKCSHCSEDAFLDLDLNLCSEFPKIKNCKIYNTIGCEECSAGYSQDLNFYLKISLDNSYVENTTVYNRGKPLVEQGSDNNCFENKVENCLIFENPTSCIKCESGYYVNKMKTCSMNPVNRINECQIYSNTTTCYQCNELFYLSGNKCERRSNLVTNCKNYDRTTETCALCESGYWLNSTSCQKRTVFINGCILYFPNSQTCNSCSDEYYINDDSNCLEIIEGCMTYDTTASTKTCNACEPNYYLPGDTPSDNCVLKKNIPNCKDQPDNSEICNECHDGYYKSGNNCQLHTAKFCKEYDTLSNKCLVCLDGFTEVNDVCQSIDVPNCLTPGPNSGECLTCAPGFFLDTSDSICKVHNLIGCHTPVNNANECQTTGCNEDFFYNSISKTCVLKSIAHCTNYVEGTAADGDTTKCNTCESGFEVGENGTCVKMLFDFTTTPTTSSTQYYDKYQMQLVDRVRSKDVCTTYDTYSDNCATCAAGGEYLEAGLCFAQNVANCATTGYEAGTNICNNCETGYNLDTKSNICVKNNLENCTTPNTDKFGCSTCASGYIKNDITLLCEKIMIPNCATLTASTFDSCSACEKGFFLIDGRCQSENHFGCLTKSSGSTTICASCKSGWYLDAGICKLIDMSGCKKMKSTTNEEDNCDECYPNYVKKATTVTDASATTTPFEKSVDLCLKNETLNCLTFAAGLCTKCDNLYKVSATDSDGFNSCEPISNLNNCLESNGIDDECELCEPHYFPETSAGKPCTKMSDSVIYGLFTSNCYGNDDSTSSCSVCKNGYKMISVTGFNVDLPPGCKTVDPTDFTCDSCLPYFEYSTDKCVPVLSSYTGACVQVSGKQDIATGVTANECLKCRNYDTHFLKSGICESRTHMVPNCNEFNFDEDSCNSCKNGILNHVKPAASATKDICLPTPGKPLIDNCEIYEYKYDNEADPACLVCKPGFYGSSCLYGGFYETPFTFDGTTFQRSSSLSFTENSIIAMPFASKTLAPVLAECSDESSPIMAKIPINQNNYRASTYNSFTQKTERYASFASNYECVSQTRLTSAHEDTFVSILGGYANNMKTQCAFSFYLDIDSTAPSSTDKMVCMQCKEGMVPFYSLLPAAAGDHENVQFVYKCIESHRILQKKYTELAPAHAAFSKISTSTPTTTSHIPNYADVFQYDTCVNGKNLFYITYKYTEGFIGYMPIPTLNMTDKFPEHFKCLDDSEIYSNNLIDGCQVHGHMSTTIDHNLDFFTDLSSDIYCMACKPGYNPSHGTNLANDFNQFARVCTKINNCDTSDSSVNTMLNGCAKCEEGYGHTASSFNPYYGECYLNSSLDGMITEDCLISQKDSSGDYKCLVCKEGFSITSDGNCISINDSTDDSNCEMADTSDVFALNGFTLTNPISDVVWKGLTEIGNLLSKKHSNSPNCSSCKEGFTLSRVDENHEVCYEGQNSSISSNCAYFINQGDINYCQECKEGYILSSSNSCIKSESLNSSIVNNCFQLTTDSFVWNTTRCASCKDDYSFKAVTSGDYEINCSYNPQCELKTNGYCQRCSKGYRLNSASKMCEMLPTDSVCYYYDKDDNCVLCREKGKWPLETKDYSGKIVIACIEPWYSYDPTNTPEQNRNLNIAMTFTGSSLVGTSPQDVADPACLDDFHTQFIEKSDLSATDVFMMDACVIDPYQDPNCGSFADNGECEKCITGYYLNSANKCTLGTIFACEEYTDRNTCSKCTWSYYLVNDMTMSSIDSDIVYCKPRTNRVCKTMHPDMDSCTECLPEFFLDVEDSAATMFNSAIAQPIITCSLRTKTNCLVYNPTADDCLVCASGYYIKFDTTTTTPPTPECWQITIDGCSVYDPVKNQCLACKSQYFLSPNCTAINGESDSCTVCLPHSKLNCSIFHDNLDECVVCEQGYYNDNGECKIISLEGCDVPKINMNKCRMCSTGYLLDESTELCTLRTALHCAVVDDSKDECLKCDSSSYKDQTDNQCKRYNHAVNCQIFHPFMDQCLACKSGAYLDPSSQLCKMYSSKKCLTYALTADNCTSCLPGFYLSGTNCLINKATNCRTFSTLKEECTSCKENSYLNLDDGKCITYTVSNCSLNHPFKDQCTSCKEGYYLSEGKCKIYSVLKCAGFSMFSDNCVSCKPGYYLSLTDGECKEYTKTNCLGFLPNSDKCNGCISGFYLNNGSCKVYTVDNCMRYDSSADKCNGCQPGFYYERGNCIPHDLEGCHTTNSVSNSCLKCNPGYYLEFGLCFEYTVKYCKIYNSDKDECSMCETSHEEDGMTYSVWHDLNILQCNLSTKVTNCETYATDKDECSACSSGYFLENNECFENPTGIPNCSLYGDEDLCLMCDNGYYLLSNSCFEPNNAINKCVSYSSEKICALCESGYALTSDFQCGPVIENSCDTHKDPSNCESCLANEVLSLSDSGNTICKGSGIQNCFEAVVVGEEITCSQCQTGYFSTSPTECQWPVTLVQNCQEYVDHGVCSKCSPGHLLSKDGSQCTSNVSQAGPNCSIGQIYPKPQCSRCEGGFYFNEEGICKSCSAEVQNCDLCDINNLSQCLLCTQGFYMDSTMTCVEYPEDPEEPEGITIKNISLIFLIAFTLLKLDL